MKIHLKTRNFKVTLTGHGDPSLTPAVQITSCKLLIIQIIDNWPSKKATSESGLELSHLIKLSHTYNAKIASSPAWL